mgnify:CR=1
MPQLLESITDTQVLSLLRLQGEHRRSIFVHRCDVGRYIFHQNTSHCPDSMGSEEV